MMGGPSDPLTERAGLAFGDRVRVRATDDTVAAEVAGRLGTIQGQTTVSLGYATSIVGEPEDDVAVNVGFDDGGNAWIAPHLVEFMDINAGSQIRIGDDTLTRNELGEWVRDVQESDR